MVTINFYVHAKRKNSTLLPVGDGVVVDGLFKDPFNLLHPVIKLSETVQNIRPTAFNYCRIAELGRYYFINGWTYDHGFWYGDLEIDALASWKPEIGALSTYVLRSSASYNSYITDTYYPGTYSSMYHKYFDNNPFTRQIPFGRYVIGIINDATNTLGGVSYYVFTQAQFIALTSYLMGDPAWLNISTDEISEGLQKAIVNPFEYIVSCMWFPFVPHTGEEVESLPFGWWTTSGIQCKTLSSDPVEFLLVPATNGLPRHPQADRGEYLNRAPYSQYWAYIPGFGEVPLNAELASECTSLSFNVAVDCITGSAELIIYGRDSSAETEDTKGFMFGIVNGQIGVPINIANMNSISSTIGQGITGALSPVLNTATEALKAFGVSGIDVSSIATSIAMKDVHIGSNGSNGSIAQYYTSPYIKAEFTHIAAENRTEVGRPLCAIRQLSTLTSATNGNYILCANRDYRGSSTAEERDMINAFLTTGIHYE